MRRILAAIAACVSLSALGVDLEQVYRDALDNDPVLGAARANMKATQVSAALARNTLLPIPVLSASVSRSELTQTQGSNEFSTQSESQNINLSVSQPIFNAGLWFAFQSARKSLRSTEWSFVQTEQNLYLRVVQNYLSVLRAQDRLDSTIAAEEAVQRQLEQIRQRFDVGLVAITDVIEAEAGYDSAVVSRIQAVGDHDIVFETLSTISGIRYEELARLSEDMPITEPEPNNEAEWVSLASQNSPTIRIAELSFDSAKLTRRRTLASNLPRVTLSGNYSSSEDDNRTQSFLGTLDRQIVGVQAQVSLDPNSLLDSRQQAYAVESAKQQLVQQQRGVARDVRNLYRTVLTDVARVAAQAKAIKSREAALEANETGYEVGTRNIVDVLQAQQALFAARFSYASARYDYVINVFLLKQAAGTLTEVDVLAVNNFMDSSNVVKKLSTATGAPPPQ